ncbi:MAG: hypothetical protein V1850_04570, partial [Candidatus Bathyarchaeota archaeon]
MSTIKSSLVKVRNITKAIKETGQAHHEAEKAIQALPEELSSVKRLIGEDNSTTIGKKLVKTGMFLIVAIPESFIT